MSVAVVNAAAAAATPAAPANQAPTPAAASQLGAAAELLEVLHLERTFTEARDRLIGNQLRQEPHLGPHRDIFDAWAAQHLSWSAVRPELLAAYAEAYTESELREMVGFYRSPTGQKALAQQPKLFDRLVGALVRLAQAHRGELEATVRERLAQTSPPGANMTPAPPPTATPPPAPKAPPTPPPAPVDPPTAPR